jgi:CubicO group peptidase (beta-lactamase class C family)
MTEIAAPSFRRAFDESAQNLTLLSEAESGHGVFAVEASTGGGQHHQLDLYSGQASADLRSVSKVLIALAVGGAIDRGMTLSGAALDLDMRIAPLFREYIQPKPAAERARFDEVRLRHLMSNTMGHRDGFLFRADVAAQNEDQLLDYIFEHPLVFTPGEHFSYSNVGWYLISALITRETSSTLSDWAREFLLEPLQISDDDVVFRRYGPYEIAASGVCMSNRDLHRIARLLADVGLAAGNQVISREWVRTMMSDIYVTDIDQDPERALQYRSYGLGLWSTADGWHYCDGSAGQLLAFKPSNGLAVSVVGESSSVTDVVNALEPLLVL